MRTQCIWQVVIGVTLILLAIGVETVGVERWLQAGATAIALQITQGVHAAQG
jgi:hypothetical protein